MKAQKNPFHKNNNSSYQKQQINQQSQVSYNKPHWVICNPSCQQEQQDIKDFSEDQPSNAIEFTIRTSRESQETKKINIGVKHFNVKAIFKPTNLKQYDLSNFSLYSQEACKKTILYCITGYAELKDTDIFIFLAVCSLLKVELPIIYLDQFLSRNPSLDLSTDFLEIFVLIFEQLKQLAEAKEQDTLQYKVFSMYQNQLMNSNPYFFMKDDTFSYWIQFYDETYFLEQIVPKVSEILFTLEQNYTHISIQQVEIFYQFLSYFYSTKIPSQRLKNAQSVFEEFYKQQISSKLIEEDQINCIQFLPSGENALKNKALGIIQENNRLKKREWALIGLIINRFGLNLSKSDLMSQLDQSMKIVSGIQIDQEIETLFKRKIDDLKKE